MVSTEFFWSLRAKSRSVPIGEPSGMVRLPSEPIV